MGVEGPTRDLGPAVLLFLGTDLGETFGGVRFRTSTEVTPVMEDRFGNQPIDDIDIGNVVELEAVLTRLSLAQLTAILPGASGSGTAGDQMVIRNVVGRSAYANAGLLVVKPIVNGVASVDSTEWLHIFKAYPIPDPEIVYDVTTQRVYKVIFRGYRVQTDETGAKAGWLWKIGS